MEFLDEITNLNPLVGYEVLLLEIEQAVDETPNDSILGDKIVIGRGIEKCLYIYSLKEWDKISSEVSKLALTQKNNRQFSRMFFSGTFTKEIDSKGRVNVEKSLAENTELYGRIEADVMKIIIPIIASDEDEEDIKNTEE